MEVLMNLILKTRILKSERPQVALARDVGITESCLSKIVNGWIEPKHELKGKIALALGCDVSDIFPIIEGALR
jgi:DNA-binding XRE family transcriptional regulator